MRNYEVVELLQALPLGLSYKAFTDNKPVVLSNTISLALGENKRNLVRVLSTVIDAINNKLFVKAITINDTATQSTVDQWCQSVQWDLRERELYKYAIRDGKSYALVSMKDNKPALHVIQVYDGREGAYIYYKDKVPALGIHTWYAGNDRFLDLYYTDKIEKYILPEFETEWTIRRDTKDEKWPIPFVDDNNAPLGIPLIEYSIGESDLADGAVQIQHDINTVIMDQLAIDRTMGYPLRYLKGKVHPGISTTKFSQPSPDFIDPITKRALINNIELPPGSIYALNADAEIGQLDSAKPDRTVFDMLLHTLSLITKVPTFYFTGEQLPSGVALIQAESPLNALVENHQSYLTPAVVSTFQIMITLSNTYAGTTLNGESIDVSWESPQVITYDLRMDMEKTQTLVITQQVSAGVRSIESAVRILNPTWDESQVQAEVARLTASTL